MKQRFSSLDVKVIAQELSNALCTLRLANVYDLSSRIFLFKFAKPDNRQSLIVESGFRCHLTNFTRATAAVPSAFVARLRKYLKTRRVTSVSQVGTDRIVELQFSDGQYRLFLEFYAGGNVVLTDRDLNVISVLRIVNEEQEQLRVGLKYSLDDRQNYNGIPDLTPERICKALQNAIDKVDGESTIPQKRSRKKPGDALRRALATSLNEFPPVLIDHGLRLTAFDPSTPIEEVMRDSQTMAKLVLALREAQNVVDSISSCQPCKGYIIIRQAKRAAAATQAQALDDTEGGKEEHRYEDFHPFRPQQFADSPETILQFDSFNKTVDEFFSSIESQKLESRLTEKEENAKRKLDMARLDHEKRLGGLQQVQEVNVRKAQAIEANLQKVQEAMAAVNNLIFQGMDWAEIARLIEMEQERKNVVAEMIKLPLKLYENTATLLLAEATYDDLDDYDGDETGSDVSDVEVDETSLSKRTDLAKPADKRLAVDIDLALSPWSNARQYYDQKKFAAVKEQKTLQSSEKALKNTEKKISADLKKGLKQEKEMMRPQRKALWFEKFVYFISSEGYLVLGGKDAQQNEILYKRYLKKGDVYVHADLQGAVPIIIKNKPGMIESPIPPSTLSQAGTLAVATSSAWDSKAVMSAWWVDADKVSKMAPTGDYLTTGSFNIGGNKNYLPPAQLLLGFGIMFKISEQSKIRHFKHRTHESGIIPPKVQIPERVVADEAESVDDAAQSESDVKEPNAQKEIFGRDQAADSHAMDGTQSNSEDSEEDIDSESVHVNPLQPNNCRFSVSQTEHPVSVSSPAESGSRSRASPEGSSEEESEQEIQEQRPIDGNSSTFLEGGPAGTALPSAHTEIIPSASSAQSAKIKYPRVRGKHGKQNKLKSKYANQDEEDRALAMHLLGSAAAQEKAREAAAAKVSKDQEIAAQRERRRRQHAIDTEKGKEAEKIRKIEFDEGVEELDDNELEALGDLDAFVGAPLPGDDILDALVVCGPWDAMGARYRWRVKLQPGSTKKGKAVREILAMWVAAVTDLEKKKRPGSDEGNHTMTEEEKVRTREGELIKAIREPEIIGVVPVGKVRIELGGKGKGGGGGGGAGKGKRGGKGSKKQR